MVERDYYQILGVAKGASDTEIKKAYRKLALQHHPDRNKGDKTSEAKFKEVTKAYEVLSDPAKKQAYDQYGHAAFEGAAGGQGPFGAGGPFGGFGQQGGPFTYTYSTTGGNGGFDFGGFSDPFEIFEQFFGGGNPFGRAQPRRPVYSLAIDFMEAVKGVTKKISIEGRAQTVKIPAGVDDGSRVRFEKYDVLIDVAPHPRFKREGYDVVTEEEITFPQAALGTEINVETVDGDVALRIPSGTAPNTVIRLSQKGIVHVRGAGRGDHYVQVKLIIPKNLSSKQKELLREFDSDSSKKHGWF